MPRKPRRHLPRSPAPVPDTLDRASRSRRFALTLALIVVLAAVVHSAAFANGFLDFDDPVNILENTAIRAISSDNIRTYFTRPLMGMYTPFVYVSFALDYRVGALDPTAYHATNLALHLLAVCLVGLVGLRLTGDATSASIAAAFFAVHPVNVAAVTPLHIRSSLLSSCFYLGAYLAYLRYVRTGQRGRWMLCLLLFIAALLSKVSAAVFPLLLLLTDFYLRRPMSRMVWLDKVPFFLASAAFGVVAVIVRPDMAAMKGSVLDYSLIERLCLAAYSLLVYLQRLVFPVFLSPLYPYPSRAGGHLSWLVYLSPLVLIAIVWIAARWRSQRRLLVFGAGVFLIHLILVLKVVPLGVEFMADRYLYLAGFGWFLVAGELIRQARPPVRRVGLACAAILVLVFSVQSYGRQADWKDSERFYSRTLARYPDSAVAHNNLGGVYDDQRRRDEALAEYQTAARLEPGYVSPHVNVGIALMRRDRPTEAVAEFTEAVRLDPGNAKAHAGLGHALSRLGRGEDAVTHLKESIRLDPGVAEVHNNLGMTLDGLGRVPDAIAEYSAALALDPTLAEPRNNLGAALATEGRVEEARTQFAEAIRLNPNFTEAHYNLAVLLARSGDRAGAVEHLDAVLRIVPTHDAARRLRDELRRPR